MKMRKSSYFNCGVFSQIHVLCSLFICIGCIVSGRTSLVSVLTPCYNKYVVGLDTLEGLFMRKGDSIYFASISKLSSDQYLPSADRITQSQYFIGSTTNLDTVEVTRNKQDILLKDMNVLDYRTYIYPATRLDNSQYTILHRAVSKGLASSNSKIYDRIFYFSEGKTCPDSIVVTTSRVGVFIYD